MYNNISDHFRLSLVEEYQTAESYFESAEFGMKKGIRILTSLCHVLYHFREHFPENMKKSDLEVEADCPDYAIVRDIANASKHGSKLRSKKSKIEGSSSIKEHFTAIEFSDEIGPYTSVFKSIVAECKDGTAVDIFEIATNVINYWGNQLVKLNLSPSFKQFAQRQKPGTKFICRSEAISMKISHIEGLSWGGFGMSIAIFNMEKGYAEPPPFPLKNAKIMLKKEPEYELEFSYAFCDQKEITVKLMVSRSQALQLKALQTYHEQFEFVKKLIKANPSVVVSGALLESHQIGRETE